MRYTLIELHTTDAVATVTLNRPDKRNAMSDDMRTEFIDALEKVAADRSIRALVLTGAGKGFCAGGDIAGMQRRMNAPAGEVGFNGWQRQQRVHQTQALLHTMPKPVIAAVNGAASGLGADTALACDFILASEWASFTWSYVLRGIVPDGGGMYFLPRRVGLSQAKQLIFTGRKVDADEALALGIVDRRTTAASLLADAQAWARELGSASPTAIALTKTILNQSFERTSHDVFAQGSQAQGICYTSSEHRAAVESFLARSAATE
ncbi:enoyl-CoA hydratase/isomerase family protein [Acidovorax sp. SUPP2522]|uniref:enoyl-CoA hydratase/isomerase family protein n=1 Tax=unclassified Acidovorax TaxID=2684926 RepID=UPI0023497ADA|nr:MULTISPECIES: enoyl-CoA hydratase/isomerase family protein [unclassified Acidovorax]WCN00021.1 enoyl-CoA hydratase/isomerase family protein [Acidovorax sp. GBBC 1281]GKT19099.1 enoyl-CoA hydratase/isomerase family protein [Acidovorax sp. SUPP2522]